MSPVIPATPAPPPGSGPASTPDVDVPAAVGSLHGDVRRALVWSALSNLVLRVGSLALGIVLARLLAPEEFGVYAVALTVQTVLMTLADLGLSADLIRADDPEERAPVVATLGAASGAGLTVLTMLLAGGIAQALGSPESEVAIQVLALTLLLGGLGVVPYAALQRTFRQERVFLVAAVDLVVSSTVTLTLVAGGHGVVSLAIGRVVGQGLALVVQFRAAGVRPRFGLSRSVSGSVLRFGAPVAAANLLSWALLSVDTVVIARSSGPAQLGLYVLAFNISSWPMSAAGQVVRSVALPGFARLGPRRPGERHDASLDRPLSLVWALALPAGCFLALLAPPLVTTVYGERWSAAAPVLALLALFGATRVAFDLFASYLLARGAARATLGIQVVWIATLVPAVVVGTRLGGIAGAATAHLVVASVVVLPCYLVTLRHHGVRPGGLWRGCLVPTAAMLPAAACVLGTSLLVDAAWARLLLGSVTGGVVYVALVGPWARRRTVAVAPHGRPEQPALTAQPAPPAPPALPGRHVGPPARLGVGDVPDHQTTRTP